MSLFGDISKEDREQAKALEEQEAWFDSKQGLAPPQILAKGYICLAHDWYVLSLEEKAQKLLDKADKICPTYFENYMGFDIQEDPDFEKVMAGIIDQIIKLYGIKLE